MPCTENRQRASRRRAARLRPLPPHAGAHAAGPGQALVELAFVLPLFLLLVFSIIDFGVLFENRIALDNAARSAARWATTHPTAWSNASSAPANTIEGQVQHNGGTVPIANSDNNIVITYLDSNGANVVPCGQWSASSNTFVPANPTYNNWQTKCVIAGNLVQVQVSDTYHMITPVLTALFPGGITESSSATMMMEVSAQ